MFLAGQKNLLTSLTLKANMPEDDYLEVLILPAGCYVGGFSLAAAMK